MDMKKIISIAVLLLSAGLLFAQKDIPARPSPQKLVNNLSVKAPGLLTPGETRSLEGDLSNFSDSTSNQITIVIVDSTNGLSAEEFATGIGDKWGVGHKKMDNGIVLLVVDPMGAAGSRDVFIAVGRGLEGAIPDLIAHRIIEKEIIPNFKEGNYYEGIRSAVEKLEGFAKGEFNTDEYAGKQQSKFFKHLVIALVILFLLFIFTRGGGGGMTMTRFGGTYWGGSFGGGSSFGGGGSGGFGGFGGGSFGGGGAGGKW